MRNISGGLGNGGTTNEPISDADHGLNAIATAVQLLSQAPNMNVQGECVTVIAVSPNLIQ
jgi:hypothetical protein